MKALSSAARGIVLAAPLILAAVPASAYVGPGAGITLLGALWGLIVAVAAAVAFLVMWPLRRYIFRRKRPAPAAGHDAPAGRTTASHRRSP